MFLDQSSRCFYNYLLAANRGTDFFTLEEIEACPGVGGDALEIAKLLEERGICKIACYDNTDIPAGMYLTQFGLHLDEYERAERITNRKAFWKDFFSRFLTGVLTGVIVTIITGLLTGTLVLPQPNIQTPPSSLITQNASAAPITTPET